LIRLKINDFKLNLRDMATVEAKLPCSLSTLMASEGEERSDRNSDDLATVEFTGVVEIEPSLLSMKNICLRIAGVGESADVILNGKTISSPDSRERIYIYNVRDRLFPGYNTLVIRFKGAEHSQETSIRARTAGRYDPSLESVELLAFDAAAINSVGVSQEHTDGRVTLNVSAGIIGNKENLKAVATLVSPSGKIYYGGLTDGKGSITVSDPLLWWPNGMGVSNLYDLSVNLYHGDTAEDLFEVKVGLRELSVSSSGDMISLSVNQTPAFLKGAVLAPEDSYRALRELSRVVDLAVAAGINAIWVSSYGKSPSNEFIDLCDRAGILLIFGVASGNQNSKLSGEDSVKREIVDGPRRISYHASTSAFCVNSQTVADAEGMVKLLSAFCSDTAALLIDGEPKENGTLALPELKTLRRIAAGEEANLLSKTAERRTEPRGSVGELLSKLTREYRFPRGTDELSYISQHLSAESIKRELTEARFEGRTGFFAPRLNDSMPLISPSAIDYYGRRKALHYHLVRLYAPVSVLSSVDGYGVRFIVLNDRTKEYSGTLTYRVLDTANRELLRADEEISALPPASRRTLSTVDLAEYLRGHEEDRYLVYSYTDGRTVYTETVLFARRKHFKYKNPKIRAHVTGSGRKFELTLYTESFAEQVRLNFSSVTAEFEDNYFDMLEGVPRRISVETAENVSAEKLSSELEITSMYDVGRDYL